jgi:hypothetical protein
MLQAERSSVRFPIRQLNCSMHKYLTFQPTLPLTEMSTRNLPEGEGWPGRKADNLTAICEPSLDRMGVSKSTALQTSRASFTCFSRCITEFRNVLYIYATQKDELIASAPSASAAASWARSLNA